MATTDAVQVDLTVEGFGGEDHTTVEIPRQEWDQMSPHQRFDRCEELANEHLRSRVSWAWNIADPEDYKSTNA